MVFGGLDFSLTTPAYAKYNSIAKKLTIGRVDTKPFKKDYRARNRAVIGEIQNMMSDVDVLFIEDYAFAACGRITDIAEALGSIKYSLPCNIYVVSPGTLKKALTGNGHAEKKEMIEKVTALGFKVRDDNEADATALLLMAMGKIKGKYRVW